MKRLSYGYKSLQTMFKAEGALEFFLHSDTGLRNPDFYKDRGFF